MTNLKLANNSLGMPNGWSGPDSDGEYRDRDGKYHKALPGGSSDGVSAIANAIRDMGAVSYEVITRESLVAFYTEHNPDGLGNVDKILQRYSVPKLKDGMQKIYGSIPDVTVIPKAKGAILSVNLLKNGIAVEQARALVIILKEHPTLKSLCGNKGNETELAMSGKMMGAGDAIMLAAEIIDNGALSKLFFGGDKYWNGNDWVTPEPATLELGMAEADLSNKSLQAAGAIVVAAWISHRDKGPISSINLLKNHIPVEQAQKLVKIMQAKESLTTLCGVSREETEIDFSGQNLGAGDAVLIANDISSDMGALSVLSLKKNRLFAGGGTALAAGLKGNQGITELDISENYLGQNTGGDADASGITAIADAIPDMGALSKFTFSGDGNTPVTMETSMIEADFRRKGLGVSGAIMLSAFLPKCT
jgi:hypothetical protein